MYIEPDSKGNAELLERCMKCNLSYFSKGHFLVCKRDDKIKAKVELDMYSQYWCSDDIEE